MKERITASVYEKLSHRTSHRERGFRQVHRIFSWQETTPFLRMSKKKMPRQGAGRQGTIHQKGKSYTIFVEVVKLTIKRTRSVVRQRATYLNMPRSLFLFKLGSHVENLKNQPDMLQEH